MNEGVNEEINEEISKCIKSNTVEYLLWLAVGYLHNSENCLNMWGGESENLSLEIRYNESSISQLHKNHERCTTVISKILKFRV